MKFAFIVTGSIFLQSYWVSDNVSTTEVKHLNLGEEEAEEEEEDEATEAENSKMEPVVRAPQMSHILEKFRHRSDKMNVRETFPLLDKVIERFSNGRKGRKFSKAIFLAFNSSNYGKTF